jgi:predicted SAM-dependent methyltransferase
VRVLNLGCGEDTYGTDRVDFHQTKATTMVADLNKSFLFGTEIFGEIYERNLLEHLRNVGFHLEECYRVLKTGGKIICITDNASCFRFYIWGTHTGRYEKIHKGDYHFCVFTKNHLLNHFMQAGFKDIKIDYVKTDTAGRWFDMFTFQHPRIRVRATK